MGDRMEQALRGADDPDGIEHRPSVFDDASTGLTPPVNMVEAILRGLFDPPFCVGPPGIEPH